MTALPSRHRRVKPAPRQPGPGCPCTARPRCARRRIGASPSLPWRAPRPTPAMPIPLPGHHAPAAGFEVPLEMLAACHGRVQAQCSTLARLLPHVAAHGADRAAQEAATAVTRYFDTAAVHHHADEERDLFPALLEAMAGSDAVCIRNLTRALAAEHRLLEARWQRLRAALAPLAAGDASALTPALVQDFAALYAATSPAKRPNCCRWPRACWTTPRWTAWAWPCAGAAAWPARRDQPRWRPRPSTLDPRPSAVSSPRCSARRRRTPSSGPTAAGAPAPSPPW